MNSEDKKDVLRNLFFHPSLDCPSNGSDYKLTNCRMNSQLGRKWRDDVSIIWGAVVAWLVMWRKTTKTSVKLKSLTPDLNPGHANYKAALVTTLPQCLIKRRLICFY
jgi:hypothetical protein